MRSFFPSPYQDIERVSQGVLSCGSNLSRFTFYDRKHLQNTWPAIAFSIIQAYTK